VTESLLGNNTITVVIPTRNAGQQLAELLDSLQKQTLKPAQIIVVDSESSDKTPELAENKNCKVIKIKKNNFDHGTTRNLAVKEFDTGFVVFLTQDVVPVDEHMIAELIEPMQTDPNIAISYGRQLPGPNARPLERFAREFNYPEHSILKTKKDTKTLGLKTFFCSNSCSAIRRSTFNELGGFKNNVIVNEDMLFAVKAITSGYSVFYNANARVLHSHTYSSYKLFQRYFNIGRFFADNKWILKTAGLESYSSNMLKAGLKRFWEKRMPHYILALLVEFTLKAFACKLGWYYQLSSHSKYDNKA